MSRPDAPPRAAERLLAVAFGRGEWAESILGDLHEEFTDRALRSRASAARWYWIQAVRLTARRVLVRTTDRRTAIAVPRALSPNPGDSIMRTLGLETRYALRSIRKRPAMSAIVVLTLALGLGANAAIFSMIDALVLRPFTMPDADRIAQMSYLKADNDIQRRVSPADFLDVKRQADVFERLTAMQWWDANLVGRDEPERVQGFFVSADFFPTLGIELARGRSFLADEETQGKHHRVVLGHGLWERRFAADPAIIGQSIDIDGRPHEVIGIAPAEFEFPMGAQLWAPLSFDSKAAANRRATYLIVIGRLTPGRTLQDAKAQMAVIGERLERDHPDTNRGRVSRVYSLAEGMRDLGVGPILSMWQAAAAFVLLIACANVASLLLARGAERQREMAVRVAMGASRLRVVRELLIESGLLAFAAIPGALLVAFIGLKLVVGYMPAKIARFVVGWHQMDVDVRLVLFTAGLAMLTALAFGLIPALQASRPRLTESLKDGGRGATVGASRQRLRRGLVVAEIALALPLLVAAGLSVLTVHRFLYGPQGFEPDHVLTMQVVLPSVKYPRGEERRRFAETVVAQLRHTPGVDVAAAVNIVPAAGNNWTRGIEIDGKPNPDPNDPPGVDFRAATPDLFAALSIPILSGRSFTEADREDTQRVAIVSASLARRYWPDVDPIGRRIRFGTEEWMTVVGISGDVIHDWFMRRNYPTLYRPFRQSPTDDITMVMRTSGDPASVAAGARAALRAVDPMQPVFDLQPLRTSLQERTVGLQYIGGIMFVFGGLALVLAVVGVYGVMAYMVTQRRHEIGVRMALGATRRDVLRLTTRQAMTLTAVGVGLGVALSLALGRLIEAGLLGVATSDARLTAGLAAVLIVSAMAAAYIPARRAASIDPTVALRE